MKTRGRKLSTKVIVVISFIVAAIFLCTLLYTVSNIEKEMTTYCFEKLDEATDHLAEDFNSMILRDRMLLRSEAALLATADIWDEDGVDLAKAAAIMNTFDIKSSYVSGFELLTADGRIINEDGVVTEVAKELDFTEEKMKGAYVSEMIYLEETDETIIKNAVPVKIDGETTAIFYGIVSLNELSQKYRISVYGGKAFVYLEDGDSGNLLLDTQNQSLGSVRDFKDSKTLPGYSFDKAIADMENGVNGSIAYISATTGKTMYMFYEPLAVNHWNVMLAVPESVALAEAKRIRGFLYGMISVDGLVLAVYLVLLGIYFWGINRRIRKAGNEDPVTGLKNRNAYNALIQQTKAPSVSTVVFIDVNGLHEVNNDFGHEAGDRLLRTVAAALKEHFPVKDIYRIGGDEFIILAETAGADRYDDKMQIVAERLGAYGYSISYGLIETQTCQSIEAAIRAADEKMLEKKRDFYKRNDRRRR